MTENSSALGFIDIIDFIDVHPRAADVEARVVPKGAVLTVAGWAGSSDPSTLVTGVFLCIDGGPPIEALYGTERPDVADVYQNPGLATSGFRGLMTTAHLVPGPHILTIVVRDASGRLLPVDSTKTFQIVSSVDQLVLGSSGTESTPIMVDEITVDGQPARDPLFADPSSVVSIRGWAIDQPGRGVGTAIFAVIDGMIVHGSYGAPRDDVAADQGDSRYRDAGYSIDIPVETISAGEHLLRIRLLGADEATVYDGPVIRIDVSSESGQVSALIPNGGMTRASIDDAIVFDQNGQRRPSVNELLLTRNDTLAVRGWAIDDAGPMPARAVYLCVDDLFSTRAVYGLERPDVSADLGCPTVVSCGFSALIAASTLSNGPHTLSVRVLDEEGKSYYETAKRIHFFVSASTS